MVKKLIIILLLCSSCASTYKFTRYERSETDSLKVIKVKVYDNSPRKYGFVLAIGVGIGEQFKQPSK